jgi:putative protease
VLKTVAYIQSIEELAQLTPSQSEVILEPVRLANAGRLDAESVTSLAEQAHRAGKSVFLSWDRLVCERDLEHQIRLFSEIDRTCIDAVRVQDPGVLQYMVSSHPDTPVHFIAETGNRTMRALKAWLNIAPRQISRIVLSPEIPVSELVEYCRSLPCETEILGIGPVLVLQTPRHLLAPVYPDANTQSVFDASCDESGHKGFRVYENELGTFLHAPKDLNLFDTNPSVCELPVSVVRVDLRWVSGAETRCKILSEVDDRIAKRVTADSRISWPRPTTRGFFQTNRTDRQFKRLNRRHRLPRNEDYLGEILSVADKKVMFVQVQPGKHIKSGQKIEILTPQEKRIRTHMSGMENVSGKGIEVAESGHFMCKFIHGAVARSAIYQTDASND